MKSIRYFTYSSVVALLLSAGAVRAADESPYKFEFHGFVTGSLYAQDQTFNNGAGQGLLYMAPHPNNAAPYDGTAATPPAGTATKSGSLWSGDIRNSRFSFGVTGPAALGGTPRGYLELDFFGNTNVGAFGTEQAMPRIRVAIAELKWGTTLLQAGQQNQLVVPQIPASISHIANPWSYGVGTIGWRTPGVRLSHTLPVGDMKLELAGEIVKAKWADVCAGAPCPDTSPATVALGQASGMPMVQGRLKLDGKAGDVAFSAYVVGLYQKANLKGFGDVNPNGVVPPGDPTAAPVKDITTSAFEVGGNVRVSMVSLAANYYNGKATGNMLGGLLQFGDIADSGYWAQLGVNLTKEFGIYGFYGASSSDEKDVRKWVPLAALPRFDNKAFGGMLRYAQAGYQVGLEVYQYTTTWAISATADRDESALQSIITAGYFF